MKKLFSLPNFNNYSIKKNLSIGFCIINFLVLYAQGNPQPVEFSATPTAAGLAKYADTPVGYYSGMPNINIPIYTIKTGGYSLPISLSYHASGIKVSQEASNVGLGWSLNGGGVITRQVRGQDDFYQDSYKKGYFYRYENYDNPIDDMYTCNTTIFNGYEILNGGCRYLDGEPDIFVFNCGKYSGKFIIQRDINAGSVIGKGIEFDKKNNLKIKFDLLANKFTITAPDGIVYEFVNTGSSQTYSWSSGFDSGGEANTNEGDMKTNSWLLSKIKMVNDSEIDFIYSDDDCFIQSQKNETEVKTVILETIGGVELDTNPKPFYTDYSFSESKAHHLEQIIWDHGKAVFNLTDRNDLINVSPDKSKKISGIEIKNDSDELIKKYELSYGYFNENFSTPPLTYNYRRLKLLSLQEVNNSITDNSSIIPPYIFKYYDEYDIPAKTSNAYDHWGLYNNFVGPPTAIPSLEYRDNKTDVVVDFVGANRAADYRYAVNGTLKSIQYPESGIVSYEYELNDYFSNKYKTTKRSSGFIDHINGYGMPINNNNGNSFVPYEDQNGFKNHYDFQIEGTLTKFTLYMELGYSFYDHADTLRMFLLKLNDDGTETSVGYINNADGVEYDEYGEVIWDPGEEVKEIRKTYYTNLQAGNYRVRFSYFNMPSTAGIDALLTGTISYTEETTEINTAAKASGLRIKKIKSPKNTREYSYTQYNEGLDKDVSSGILMSKPKYYITFEKMFAYSTSGVSNIKTAFVRYLQLRSNSYHPTSSALSGKIVGYSKVTESILDSINGENVKTVYDFFNIPEVHNVEDAPNFHNIENGNLLSITEYNKIRKNFYSLPTETIVKKTSYQYTLDDYYTISCASNPPNRPARAGMLLNQANISPLQYDLETALSLIESEKTITYNGENQIINKAKYKYDYTNKNRQPKSIARKTSDGSYIINKYYYPEDIGTLENVSTSELSTANSLVTNYRINTPIQTETYKTVDDTNNYQLLNTSRLSYKFDNGLIVPEFYKQAKGDESLEEKVKYERYDNTGNILEISNPESDVHTSYIWGYNGQYPIAKIDNARYVDIESLSSFGPNFSISGGLSTIQEEELRNLPKALVTTYTYKELIGITSVTDTRGNTINYHYDAHNRLEFVTDYNGDVLSKNEYYYKNQQ